MKKFNWYVILIIVLLILFESICYLLAKLSPFESILLTSFIDDKIPLISYFVYFYVIWYLMLLIVPYIIYLKNRESFIQYITSFVICVLISTIIFFLIPTTIAREKIVVDGLTTFILKVVYAVDTPVLNCFPSMHCVACFLFIYFISKLKNLSFFYKIIINVLSILVILSTLFIKQHVLLDVIGAFILVMIALYVNKKIKFSFANLNIFKRIDY